jgi:hypothetical protein
MKWILWLQYIWDSSIVSPKKDRAISETEKGSFFQAQH